MKQLIKHLTTTLAIMFVVILSNNASAQTQATDHQARVRCFKLPSYYVWVSGPFIPQCVPPKNPSYVAPINAAWQHVGVKYVGWQYTEAFASINANKFLGVQLDAGLNIPPDIAPWSPWLDTSKLSANPIIKKN